MYQKNLPCLWLIVYSCKNVVKLKNIYMEKMYNIFFPYELVRNPFSLYLLQIYPPQFFLRVILSEKPIFRLCT